MPSEPTWDETVDSPAWDDTVATAPGAEVTRSFKTSAQAEKLQRQFLPTAISPEQWAGMSERMNRAEQYRRAGNAMNEAGTGLTDAIYNQAPRAIGQAFHDVGNAIYEGGVNAIANTLPEFQNDPNEIAQQYDTETAIRSLPTGQRVFARMGEGVVKSAPQMGIALVNPVAGAVAFGFTPEGFSVKNAAIAAALPFIGSKAGAVAESVGARLGMTSDAALGLLNKAGGVTAAAGTIGADEAYRISQLPEAEQGEAWVDATANIASQFLLGAMGHTERFKSTERIVEQNRARETNANAETMKAVERDFNRRNAGPVDEGADVPTWEGTETAKPATETQSAQRQDVSESNKPERVSAVREQLLTAETPEQLMAIMEANNDLIGQLEPRKRQWLIEAADIRGNELTKNEAKPGKKVKPAKGGDVTIQQQSTVPQADVSTPSQSATTVKRVASGLRARKVFDRETELGGPDILSFIQEFGGMQSKTEANRNRGKDWWAQNKSLYDDAAPLQRPQHNIIYGGKSYPDQIAQAAYNAKVLKSPDVNELWIAIRNASNRRAKAFSNVREQESLIKAQEEWHKATQEGELRITPEELQPGDTFEVDGERFKVQRFDKTTGDVIIQDGPRFGRQRISAGESIWVENAGDSIVERIAENDGNEVAPSSASSDAAAAHERISALFGNEAVNTPKGTKLVPKLRAGEKGTGDLLQGEDAPFNLAGEKATDGERIAAAKAEAEATARAAAEFAAKNQQDMFGGGINSGNLGELGMGGAKPGEFRNNPTTPTGIRNAIVDQERVKRGLPPAMEAARKDFGSTWDEAMARLDQDPEASVRLVTELQRQARPLNDVENALLLQRQIQLQNEYGKLTRELAQAYDDGQAFPNRLETMEQLKVMVSETSDALQALYDIGKAVGTEQGRGLAARKMLAFEDYSLAKMEMEKRAAKGGAELTDADRAELVRLQAKIERTEQEFQAYQEKVEAERANRMTDQAIRDMQEELKRRPNYDSRIVKIAEEIVSKLEKQATDASARLKSKFARTNTGLDPTIIYDLGVVGAAKIARAGLDFGKFSVAMLAEYGAGVQDYLQAAWERANLHLDNEGAKYGDKAPLVKASLRKRDALSKRENVVAGLKKGKAEGIPIQMEGDYIRKLAEGFVEGGITQREPLIDAVHKVLTEEIGLDLTRRETMDAISGYGKFKPLNPDAIKATLRELKGQMQQVAKLEDIQARQPLKKTGLERRVVGDEERRLLQQVNEAKRRYGVVVDDPARQLKSALDAIKTRLKNQIADIEFQISTKERIVKTKTPASTDLETTALQMKRDELRGQLDALLPKPGLTPEQQAAQVMRGIERSIADYERRIETKDVVAGERKAPLSTPQIEALRARREALRAEWEEMRDASEAYQRQQYATGLERQKSALEESIKAKEAQLAAGPQPAQGRAMNRPADPVLESLMQQRDALNAKLAEARRKPAAQKYAEQLARRLETMQRQIAERQAKFDAGDYSTQSRTAQQNRPLPPELEIAKQQLEAINAKLAEARRGPQLSPEQKSLKALKARLAQSTASYVERLAKQDFSKRQRREPTLDAEALRLKTENEIAKREFHRGVIMDRLANRSTGQKVYAGVKEALNLPRNLLSSWDVSAVLRQGGFIAIGNPLRAGRALAPMFRALASEKAAVMVEQEILSRPTAPLYKQSKLYLAPHEALHLSAMEEQIMSRLGNKIPGLAASNRAYITFLNRLRADSFDALVESISSKDGSLNAKEAQAVANYINVATGRGDLGKASAAAETLATVFFSPRLMASRFQLLAGQPLYRGTSRTRRAVAQEYGKFLAGIAVVYGLGSLAGATIENDTRSSDFAKLKFGNTRLDVLAGLGQNTTLLSRLATGKTVTASGEVRPIRGELPYGANTSADVIAAFLRSKLSPVVGNSVDLLTGKSVVGQPVTPGSVAINMTVPLSFRDIYDVMREHGMAAGTALSILSLFGFGLQNYESKAHNAQVDEMMRHVRGVTPEQRKIVRQRLEEATQ